MPMLDATIQALVDALMVYERERLGIKKGPIIFEEELICLKRLKKIIIKTKF